MRARISRTQPSSLWGFFFSSAANLPTIPRIIARRSLSDIRFAAATWSAVGPADASAFAFAGNETCAVWAGAGNWAEMSMLFSRAVRSMTPRTGAVHGASAGALLSSAIKSAMAPG